MSSVEDMQPITDPDSCSDKVDNKAHKKGLRLYLRYSTSICFCLAGFGIAAEIDANADPRKVIAVWLTIQLLFVVALASRANRRSSPQGYKHPQWSELAHGYALRLGIQSKEVWVIEDHLDHFLARAEPDRIVVRRDEASKMSDRSMEFVIAHEMAHYYPQGSRWVANLLDFALGLMIVVMCALSEWWTIPVIVCLFGLVRHLLKNFEYRTREHLTDLLAMQITSPSLALDTYGSHEERGVWRFLKREPSYNARRNFLLRHIDGNLES